MNIFKKITYKLFKKKNNNEPWLSYYSKEDKSIKFTNKTIYEYLKESNSNNKDYIALNYFGTRISYGEFFQRIEHISKSLRALGVKQGDIVTICMPNTPEAVEMFYAVNNVGAIADMVHPLSAPNQIKDYLLQSKSRILMLIDQDYEKLKDILPRTYVYKTIITSASESMPPFMSAGYFITRGIRIKKPRYTDRDYLSWRDFWLIGSTYKNVYPHKMKSKDTAIILHSGGTTGKPKGIMVSNYSFNAIAQQGGVAVFNVRPQDKVVSILPIFHGFGLGILIHCPLCLQTEVILVPEYDSNRFYKMMKKEKPHILAGVPTLWTSLLNNKKYDDVDMSNLKYVISGGDYLTLSMEDKMNNFLHTHGAKIIMSKGYGMTESIAATAFTMEGSNEPGSVGIPLISNSYCICKPNTTLPLPLGEEGEICVTGPTIMQGYLNDEEETKKVLKKHDDGRTWLHTGDIGYISASGVVYFTQRLKRMIVTSGFNVYPSTIEELIESHANVSKCCVIGIPHPYKVQVPKAFIVLKKGADEKKTLAEIKELCKANLSPYAIPREYEFRSDLPKTLFSKIDFLKLEQEEKNK